MHGVQTALRNVPSKVEDCEQETYNDSTICAICQLQPEDMLIFACQHNLCIACATEVYAVSAHGSNRLACEICLEETQLDEETVICLKNLAKKDSHKSTAEKTDRSKVQARLPPRHKECDVGTCEQHRQKAIYYCFDCQSHTICSECMLTPAHQNHRVQTIKKSLKSVVDSISNSYKELETYRQRLLAEKESILNHRQKAGAAHAEKQESLKKSFDVTNKPIQQMVRMISVKYSELSNQLEKVWRRNAQILDGSLEAINEKCSVIQESIKIEKQIVTANDPLVALQYYEQMPYRENMYKPQLPDTLPWDHSVLVFPEETNLSMKEILDCIVWREDNEEEMLQVYREKSRSSQHSVRREQSTGDILISKKFGNPHKATLGDNLKRYSEIKCSRRLQLSRSIDNANNIINKLQQRIKIL